MFIAITFQHSFRVCILMVQVNKGSLILNDTYNLSVILMALIKGGNVHTINENAEALVMTSKNTRQEVNADKTKHIIMCQEQNVGRSLNIKAESSLFEMVEDFKYLGTNLTNQILFRK